MLFTNKRQMRAVWHVAGLFILAALLVQLVVHAAVTFLHMVPCELCLWERGPWHVLLGIGVLTLVLSPRFARWSAVAGVVCLGVSVGLGVLHVGVEHGLWPSPAAECHASLTQGHDFKDWMSHLPARPAKPCDLPDYPLGLPVSMTTLSALYALLVLVCGVVETIRLFRFVRNRDEDE